MVISDIKIKKKSYSLIFGFIFVFAFALFLSSSPLSSDNDLGSTGLPQIVDYEASACVSTTGSFEGRKTEASAGIMEFVGCDHNIFFGSGINATRDSLKSGVGINVTTISICNATAGCGEPNIGDTQAYTVLGSCGLNIANGTYTDYGVQGNWTISNTFTSTCPSTQTTNVSMLRTTTGTNFSGASFTLVSLENTDQVNVNWSLGAR